MVESILANTGKGRFAVQPKTSLRRGYYRLGGSEEFSLSLIFSWSRPHLILQRTAVCPKRIRKMTTAGGEYGVTEAIGSG
jgi:hypothetical protein